MAFCGNFLQLFVGRTVQCIGVGIGLSVVTTYLTEVAPAGERGRFPSLVDLFTAFGMMLGYVGDTAFLGHDGDWRWILALGSVLPLICLIFIISEILPESPRFLAVNGNIAEAKTVLSRLVGESEAVVATQAWEAEGKDMATWREVLCPRLPRQRRALCIGLGVFLSQSLCGAPVVASFLAFLITEDARLRSDELVPDAELVSDRSSFLIVTGVGLARFSAVCVAVLFLIDRIGRRTLMICSSLGVALAYGMIGVANVFDLDMVPWKVLGFAAVAVLYNLGMGPTPLVYGSEIFDNRMRSKSVSLCMFVSRLYSGAALFAFPTLMASYTAAHICFGCMVLNLVSCAFLCMFVPETSGTTLENVHCVLEPQ